MRDPGLAPNPLRIIAWAGTTRHLCQGRYGSVIMDEMHLSDAIRYVTLNPVQEVLPNAS
ncbi:MAG: hypothetical protein P1V13_22385 [Rhizobiaceae bacterium]|nr:hypothetical protein [Rhizobiaceae bacterium]